MVYQLRATLKGHTQDVRDVVAISNERIASVSRDGTVRVWEVASVEGNGGQWTNKIIHSSDSFLNSISYDHDEGLIYFGGKDSLVNAKSVFSEVGEDPILTLVGHGGNVCSLRLQQGTLISGSWDKTSRVWSQGVERYVLKGHTASVWDACPVPHFDGTLQDVFITASADKTVRLWKKDQQVQCFTGIHEDVIRKVSVLDNGRKFVTASNDTTIKICDLETGSVLKTLSGHESFVYSVIISPKSKELISCGEDRSVRIWSYEGDVQQVIRLPAISIWCVDVLPNGDIIVGSSDNTIRIFTRDSAKIASKEEIDEFEKSVANFSLSSKTMDFDESKLSPYEILQQPGKKEGQVAVVKSPTGVIEAYQFSQGKWSKVGDVVSSGSGGNDSKIEFEGNLYDYVFDVDIEENKPPLKLPVNANDNPYTLADNFITRYELPSSYRDQIVNFIIKNTGGVSLDAPTNEGNLSNYKVLPVKRYLSILNFKPDSIFSGIVKLNQQEMTFDDESLAEIGAALHDIDHGWELLANVADTMRTSWKNKVPAFDIMRVIVTKLPNSTDISKFVEEGLDNKNISIAMLTVRLLNNCFENKIWGMNLMGSSNVKESIFETIGTIFPDATRQQSANYAVAVSTLLLNYTILLVQDNSHMDVLHLLADAINSKFSPLEEFQGSEEAAYRLAVAYGNLSTIDPTLKKFANSVVWLKNVKIKYNNVPRFNDLFSDLSL
ncbi:hypothetical protein Kpol_1054p60 [Vanderwaltozyma polyspora DSM 70294]|uniref:Protein DOA1 n=1 Tax=Vanderwaltozyma polyspora (strain ATCC 22028 / DSM 70294 / BCRC 21397 / CBS 2163 / NBRC 10782 / NRRL Y-8283 / UCD 57-17) TaxID=436907 RepID=A7TIE6_VANPO|nr:uncharacterized protein Kpol_1054p60 [Vanderwaltozyma polyspora DSM 70294]EDO18012.1 hypothetical protein Kpol_1054p60 [Vanderwaltozyma polyspora DSM 70294]